MHGTVSYELTTIVNEMAPKNKQKKHSCFYLFSILNIDQMTSEEVINGHVQIAFVHQICPHGTPACLCLLFLLFACLLQYFVNP